MTLPEYFNLDPKEFGLDIGILVYAGQSVVSPRGIASQFPGKCYDECNDAMLEAEANGKTPDLCETDSAFSILVRACQACVHSVNVTAPPSDIIPQFQQFLYYCQAQENRSTMPSSAAPTTSLLVALSASTQASLARSAALPWSSSTGTQGTSTSPTTLWSSSPEKLDSSLILKLLPAVLMISYLHRSNFAAWL